MAQMATPDIVILIVVLVSALIGLARGLLKELLSLASWFAALILALYFAPTVAAALKGSVSDEPVRLVIGFVAVFVGTLVVGGIIQWLVRKLVDSTGLTGTDRLLGFLFGSARGALVCIIGLIAMRPFVESRTWWNASVFTPELLAFEQDVLELMGKARDLVTVIGNQM
jgi:membrane protein required for colicin V production